MKNKNKSKGKESIDIVDSVVILLNLASVRCLLPYIVLPFNKATWIMGFAILVDIVYFVVFVKKMPLQRYLHIPAAIIFVVLLFYNFINTLIQGTASFVTGMEYIVLALLFLLIMASVASKITLRHPDIKDVASGFSKGYVWLSMFSIIGVLVTFILLRAGLERSFPIDSPILADNEEKGASYVWTFFSTRMEVFDLTQIRVPFFQDYGILTGLFHEPHVLAINIFPCLILLLGLKSGKLSHGIIITLMMLFVLFCGSTANILSLLLTLFVFLFLSSKKNLFKVMIGVVVIFFVVMAYVSYDDTLLQFVLGRLDVDNGSQEASRNLLEFAFIPRTLFGTDMFSSSMMEGAQKNEDVGFIPFFMNITFLFFYFKNVIKLILSKDNVAKATGYASLYYIIHSAKNGMLMYRSLMPLFLVFLQFVVIDYYGRIRIAGKMLSPREGTES